MNKRVHKLKHLLFAVIAVAVLLAVAAAVAQENPITSTIKSLSGKSGQAASQSSRTTQPSASKETTSAPVKSIESGTEISEAVRMSRPGTFEIHVQGADLRGVLQLLSTQGRKNIVATREVTGTVTADLYGVNFKDALEAVLQATGFVYREKEGFIYIYTPKQLEDVRKAERKMVTRVFHLAFMNAKDIKDIIAPAISKEAVISITPEAGAGVGASNTDAGGNSLASNDTLIVMDYEDNIKEIERIIRELDVKPDQILLEVTMLDATLTEHNALGVNFSTLAGIDFESLGSTSTALGNMSNAGLSGTSLDKAPASTFRTDFPTTSGGMTIGFVSNNVAAFITALEDVTDVTVLANPKLLLVNKQRGQVLIGDSTGYLTSMTTESSTTSSVQFLDTGTNLIVRPFIARDGYIRLEIHPENSKGSNQIVGNNVVPSKTTTEMTTNVLVRDGHTIVMGGLFREETTNLRDQIPGLGNLPYVGAAFRYIKDTTVRREIIILLTPHIIKQAADEAVSEQLKDDVYRNRIGQRKGVQWFGRDRLAQMHLNWARQALNDGKEDLALWNAEMALSLQPRLIDAINIKEQLTGKAFWSDYYQDTSVFYIVQQMMMQDLGKPYKRIIPPEKPLNPAEVDPAIRDAFGIGEKYEDPISPFGQKKPAQTVRKEKVKLVTPDLPVKPAENSPATTTRPAKAEK